MNSGVPPRMRTAHPESLCSTPWWNAHSITRLVISVSPWCSHFRTWWTSQRRDGAHRAAHVEGLARPAEHDRHDAGVAGQHPQVGRAHRAAEVEQRVAGPVFEFGERDQHGEVWALTAAGRDGLVVVEGMAADLTERVGLALRQRPGVIAGE
jgi:hypothetical protein